ncbi:hypothetical protein FLA_3948 [Filimonas lacunae]|nr:hypothetical protein FLA_3948 [Filimonas lacunae]
MSFIAINMAVTVASWNPYKAKPGQVYDKKELVNTNRNGIF